MTRNNAVAFLLFLSTIALVSIRPPAPAAADPPSQAPPNAKIRVGVFNGSGASPDCVLETFEALRIDRGIEPSLLSARDISLGALRSLDVVVFPGGSGSKEYLNLGLGQRETIRSFVLKDGKGIVGICAGAYLISDSEGYPCLNLLDANTLDREHDKRGSALAEIAFTDRGLAIFPEMKGFAAGFVQYHDGPVFAPVDRSATPAYEELAILRSDIFHTGNAPSGMTPGRPFFLCQEAGKGRLFACVGHPEATAGMRWIVPRMARWTARRELVSYSPEVVRPALNDAEILHSDAFESDLFWKLLEGDPQVRMDALQGLVDRRHRNGVRWAIGCLRDGSPAVRSLAARILMENEHTAAIPDLEAAVRVENDASCRESLDAALRRLRGFSARR